MLAVSRSEVRVLAEADQYARLTIIRPGIPVREFA